MSLALNYEPEVVVNIEPLTREEWLDYRRLGIGGSDVAAIMGISPFATIKDLYYDKIGVKPTIDEGESNWVAKEVGHRFGRSGSHDLLKKDRIRSFSCPEDVPASLLSVHACRCRLFYPVSGWKYRNLGM